MNTNYICSINDYEIGAVIEDVLVMDNLFNAINAFSSKKNQYSLYTDLEKLLDENFPGEALHSNSKIVEIINALNISLTEPLNEDDSKTLAMMHLHLLDKSKKLKIYAGHLENNKFVVDKKIDQDQIAKLKILK